MSHGKSIWAEERGSNRRKRISSRGVSNFVVFYLILWCRNEWRNLAYEHQDKKLTRKLEDNIERDITDAGCECVRGIGLAHDVIEMRAFLNTAMGIWVLCEGYSWQAGRPSALWRICYSIDMLCGRSYSQAWSKSTPPGPRYGMRGDCLLVHVAARTGQLHSGKVFGHMRMATNSYLQVFIGKFYRRSAGQKSNCFYGTQRLITAFTKANLRTLPLWNLLQSTHHASVRSILMSVWHV